MDDKDIEVKMREFGFTDKEIQFFHKYKELDSKETLTFQLKGLRRGFYGMLILYAIFIGIWINIYISGDSDSFKVFTAIMIFLAVVIYIMTPFKLGLKAIKFLKTSKLNHFH